MAGMAGPMTESELDVAGEKTFHSLLG